MSSEDGENPTQILICVNQSSIKGYPHPSLSCLDAYEWALKKLLKPSCRHLYKVTFLHVEVPDEDGFEDMDSVFASPQDFENLREQEWAKGVLLLQYFLKRCNEQGVPSDALLKRGNPKEVICAEVKKLQPDMVIVGSRGLGPVQRIFVGTVSEYIFKHADCPVIVIKRKTEDTPEDPVDD